MKSSPGCCPAAPTPAQAAGIERRSSCHGCGARPEARHKAGRAGCACPGTAARTKKEPSRPGLCRGFPPPAAGSGPPLLGPPRPAPSLSARPAAAGFPVGGRRSGPGAARVPAGVARPAPRVGLRGLRAARCAAPPCPSPPAPLGGPSFPGRRLGSPAAPPATRSPAVGPPSRPRLPARAPWAAGGFAALAAPGPPRRGPAGRALRGAPCLSSAGSPAGAGCAPRAREVTRALRAGAQGPTHEM